MKKVIKDGLFLKLSQKVKVLNTIEILFLTFYEQEEGCDLLHFIFLINFFNIFNKFEFNSINKSSKIR